MEPEFCEVCGRTIGASEIPHVVGARVVCSDCAANRRRGGAGDVAPLGGDGPSPLKPAATGSSLRDLIAVGRAQRRLIQFVVVCIVLGAPAFVLLKTASPALSILLSFTLVVVQFVLAFRLARAIVRSVREPKWRIWAFLTFIPVIGLFAILDLLVKSNKVLRAGGISVGFLGVKKSQIISLAMRSADGGEHCAPAAVPPVAPPVAKESAVKGGGTWKSVKQLFGILVSIGLIVLAWQHFSKPSAPEMFNRGLDYYNGQGVPQDYAKAMEWFRKAAAAGIGRAMNNIGMLYTNGQGVPQDYAKAMEWFRKGAAAGSGLAMNNIGVHYDNGQGAPQDYAKAMEWYRKAAAAGSGDAMYNIGVHYDNGQGVPQDYAKAMEWFRKAAAAGSGLAMCNVGTLYASGQGVPQDYAKALEWYRKAAAAGSGAAMYNIGVHYADGQGVPQDYAKAMVWLGRAEKQGGQAAAVARKVIKLIRAIEASGQ